MHVEMFSLKFCTRTGTVKYRGKTVGMVIRTEPITTVIAGMGTVHAVIP